MQATRHSQATGIFYQHLRGIGWQHLDTNDGNARQIGPCYKTQAELLADHADYLQRAGWIRTA